MEKQRSITKEQLADLIKKYKIGKKPLSKLLGWGETTVLLYSAMDVVPDNEYTERLYQLYIDKGQYLEVLLQNRSNITDIAFRKSLRAIHEPIFENKILVTAQYIIDINKRAISQARLDVILMWSQIMSLYLLDKPIFEDIYQPSKGNGNSPYRIVAEKYKEKHFFSLSEDHVVEEMKDNLYEAFKTKLEPVLTDKVKEIVTHISDMFAWYGEKAFLSILASERFRLCGPPDSKIRRSASNDMLKKVYSDVFEQAKVKKLTDLDSFISKRIDILRKKIGD
ncbi:MAG: hypothetical protein IKW90_02735 [Lachnospiraceae bacterium]|nr:hypothetical protein [Lachnospiraceae bacterium]